MSLIKKIETEDGLLLLWKLVEEVDRLIELYPEARIDGDFQRITNTRRQKEWIVVRLMLRMAGLDPECLTYSVTGCPEIRNDRYSQISISHSKKLAGILLNPVYPVGLDIENPARDFVRVENKYLTPEEINLARTLANGHGLFWCIKEAVYKMAGIPGLRFAGQIRIDRSDDDKLYVSLITKGTRSFNVNYIEVAGQLVVYLMNNGSYEK